MSFASVMLSGAGAAGRHRSNGKRTPGGAALPPLSYFYFPIVS